MIGGEIRTIYSVDWIEGKGGVAVLEESGGMHFALRRLFGYLDASFRFTVFISLSIWAIHNRGGFFFYGLKWLLPREDGSGIHQYGWKGWSACLRSLGSFFFLLTLLFLSL